MFHRRYVLRALAAHEYTSVIRVPAHPAFRPLQELRQTAKFAQYGLAASAEALKDAGFEDGKGLDVDMTVRRPHLL